MEKRNIFFSVLDLTLILSSLYLNDQTSTTSFYGSDEEGSEVSLATRFMHDDHLSSYSSKLTSLRHETIYNSFMRNVLSNPPALPQRQRSQNQTTVITPGREVIAMVVNAPVMTLMPGFTNFSQRTDPLHDEFNLFEAFQPSRMTEDAIRNLLMSSGNENDSDTESMSSTSPISEISRENDAILPILDTSDFRLQTEEHATTIDSFLSEYEMPSESLPMETHVSSNPNFHSPRLSRGELFPALDSSMLNTIDELELLQQTTCARPSYALDHNYCSLGTSRYSVRAREKITTRVIAAPPRRVRTNIEEDEGLGAVANQPLNQDPPTSRTVERRITIGSDSGVEDDFEQQPTRIQLTNCRNNLLYKVSIAQELVCAKQ